jgi:hypothetical protein
MKGMARGPKSDPKRPELKTLPFSGAKTHNTCACAGQLMSPPLPYRGVVQGAAEAHFFLSATNTISLGSPVSASPAASWNLPIAARVAGPTDP